MSAPQRTAILAVFLALLTGTAARCEDEPQRGVAWLMGETAPHGSIGAKLALTGGIDRSGLLVMMTAGTHGVATLAGGQFKHGNMLLVGLVGAEAHPDEGLGARFHFELWTHPTPVTTAAFVVSCGSAEEHCWSRARFGMPIFGLQFGPEVVVASDRAGVGLAVTGARFGDVDVEVAFGAERDWDGEIAPYGSLALIRPF